MTLRGAFDFETWQEKDKTSTCKDSFAPGKTQPVCAGFVVSGDVEDSHFICDEAVDTTAGLEQYEQWNPNKLAEDALRYMLTRDDVDQWWAHNMGKFDGLILSAAAQRLGWIQSAQIAGGNRIICLAMHPPKSKQVVKLFDSFALVPASLRSCGEDFELSASKLFTKDDYSIDARKWGQDKLKAGCLIDCKMVLQLLDKLETFIVDWGGHLRSTFSASALTVVKADLKERSLKLPKISQRVNETARKAYYGARIEVFRHMPQETLCELDFTSSYPHSMTQRLPWMPVGYVNPAGADRMLHGEKEGIIHAIVTVPRQQFPPLPYKSAEKGIFFPTGKWSGFFAACELRYAVQHCGVQARTLGGIEYVYLSPFEPFVHKIFELKRTAKGALRNFAKLMLNGAYGKFGQKPEHHNLQVFANEEDAATYTLKAGIACRENHGMDCKRCGWTVLNKEKSAIAVKGMRWPKHTHYAIASYITAYSRISLHKALTAAVKPAYCDTDSIHCAGFDRSTGMLGDNLGQLKVELEAYRGEFYAPKIYRMTELSGETHVACKGFPVFCSKCARLERKERPKQCADCSEQFDAVVNSTKVSRGRMQLLRTQLKTGGNSVNRVTDNKHWKGSSTKRRPFKDGDTEAWTVNDILEGKHKQAQSPWSTHVCSKECKHRAT